ncbi:MBL fold metallo-hydrolase [Roseospira visakhapatnamensis]|uniref:Metallo-beta-lactamase domain-containing protein n=1 Tax=Roseospira visakhapatnamensis TaxID=390880 RepID=A0A7W6RBC3_9PROT|nr:MBL fold metallo-hydrolase [Roseospira visakhapatnamensis]MBB4264718.1 hypothetical protein [Roseospira visakhapatnamensis]
MRFYFLGTGSAFTLTEDNFQSNAILETEDGGRLLIDCGTDARHALKAAGLCQRDLSAVYISHLHGDHVGGLEWLGFTTYFNPDLDRPILYIQADLAGPLWRESLKAGMEVLDYGHGTLDDFFDVRPLPATGSFLFGGVRLGLVPLTHIASGEAVMRSYGLMIHAPGGPVLFTSDCLYQPDVLMPYYRAARLIFHDCDTGCRRGGAHCHYSDLVGLPADVKRKTWLYHAADGPRPDAAADGFLGFAQPRQVFDLGAERPGVAGGLSG